MSDALHIDALNPGACPRYNRERGVVQTGHCLPITFYFGQEMTRFWEFLINVNARAEKAGRSEVLIRYLQLMLSALKNDYIRCNT
jgi:hypothetical protein